MNLKLMGLAGGMALMASTAMATEIKTFSTIEALPESGSVAISGTVSEVEDKDTFILKDSAGTTIDVHTTAAADVKAGQKVTVTGIMKDELLGMGREITDAEVSDEVSLNSDVEIDSEINNDAIVTVSTDTKTTADAEAGAESSAGAKTKTGATTDAKAEAKYDVDVTAEKDAEANADLKEETAVKAKTGMNTSNDEVPAYDVDVDVEKEADAKAGVGVTAE